MAVLKSRESLAVKYRPKRLEEMIGQDRLVSLLKGQFRSKLGINRSFLIAGATGTGKSSLARILAHYINCEDFDTENCRPCGVCSYCKQVEKGVYGGVEEINFSDSRGIDTVRAIIDSTNYAAAHNASVFICDEIQQITNAAQNALLKILEEPPEGVILLLVTTDPNRLLPTIINRCCPLALERVSVEDLSKHLLYITKKEARDYFTPASGDKAEVEKAYAIFKNIAMFSNGIVRQAIATLEAVLSTVEGGEKIDTQDVEAIRRVVGMFIENPDVEPNIAGFLISGIYSGRYGVSLSHANKMVTGSNASSAKYLFEKALVFHIQTLYFMVDPKKNIANLTEAYYTRWYVSLEEAAGTRGMLQLVHQSAAEIVVIFMELLTELGRFIHDEKRLITAYVVKMIDAVNRHKHLAYTQASPFHRIYSKDILNV